MVEEKKPLTNAEKVAIAALLFELVNGLPNFLGRSKIIIYQIMRGVNMKDGKRIMIILIAILVIEILDFATRIIKG